MRGELPSVCVAVLNWNGREHLEILLPGLLDAVSPYNGTARIVVLDNPGPSNDPAWLNLTFPGIEVVRAPRNDFLFSYNWLLPQMAEETVVLLNNDLRVRSDFLEPLCRHFSDPNVFAVGAQSLDWGGRNVTSAGYVPAFHHGWGYWKPFESPGPAYTAFAVGGFAAINRAKFLELGGFDRLYYPAYGEDSDLCYRAWGRGWTSIYEPASIVWHREGGSWDADADPKRLSHLTRTQFLFNCRHFSAPHLRIQRALYLRWQHRQRMRMGDAVWCSAIATARRQWDARPKAGPGRFSNSSDALKRVSQLCGLPYPSP